MPETQSAIRNPQSAIEVVAPQALEQVLAALGDQRVPHLDQYFGMWAIEELRFRAAVNRLQGLDLRGHVAAAGIPTRDEERPPAGYTLTDGVAVHSLTGPLMKFVGSLTVGTSTVATRRALRAAVADERVQANFLLIDSPGGTVAGTHDLAEDVAWAATRKPLYAYIADLGASAAYWIAAPAQKIFAGPTALVGSLGTFGVIYDFSNQAAMMGIKTYVVRAGAFKGAGTEGSEITPAQLAEWQRLVDDLNEHFLAGVARGRRLSIERVRELADGRVHLAADAGALGLIDGVRTMDQALAELRAVRNRPAKSVTRMTRASIQEHESMTETMTNEIEGELAALESPGPTPVRVAPARAPGAATLAELKAALPDSNAEFREGCMEKEWTLPQAKDAWLSHLQEENARQAKELAVARSPRKKPGVEALETPGRSGAARVTGDALADFDQQVRERMAGGLSRQKAILAVAREDPELHEAYLLEVNAAKPQTAELIRQRFAMA